MALGLLILLACCVGIPLLLVGGLYLGDKVGAKRKRPESGAALGANLRTKR